MRDLRSTIVRYAPESDPVLVQGETGTGKFLIAQALHRLSPRRARDPVTAALAGYGETALSELFGCRKGAYTGAILHHDGLFKQANGSSLVLEDVPDLPLAVQAMLLRAIEEKKFRPMHATGDVAADVRVIATSNRPLEAEIREGRFRIDLFHRLKVLSIAVPSLRDRLEDLVIYVPHFLRKAARPGEEPKRMSEGGMAALREHAWPGNVRELANLLRQAALVTRGPVIGPEETRALLPTRSDRSWTSSELPPVPLDKATLMHTLLQAGWNKSKASRKLSIDRTKLYRLIQKYRILIPPESERLS